MANRSYKAEKVLERLSKKLNRQVVGSLVACVHCGMCTDSCHYVLTNPDDPTYAPAYKADKLRKLFKRHHDWTGRVTGATHNAFLCIVEGINFFLTNAKFLCRDIIEWNQPRFYSEILFPKHCPVHDQVFDDRQIGQWTNGDHPLTVKVLH